MPAVPQYAPHNFNKGVIYVRLIDLRNSSNGEGWVMKITDNLSQKAHMWVFIGFGIFFAILVMIVIITAKHAT